MSEMTAEDVAKAVEDKVNVFGCGENMRSMVSYLTSMHRTLVQSFVGKFVIPYVKNLAEKWDSGSFDARNECACKMCKLMFDGLLKEYPWFKEENMELPMV